MCSHLNHVEIFTASSAKARCFFGNLVRIFPVETVKTHARRQLGDDPPIRLSIARCIVKLLIQAQSAFAVGTHKVLFAPGGCREHDIGKMTPDRLSQVDVLIDNHHPAGIRACF